MFLSCVLIAVFLWWADKTVGLISIWFMCIIDWWSVFNRRGWHSRWGNDTIGHGEGRRRCLAGTSGRRTVLSSHCWFNTSQPAAVPRCDGRTGCLHCHWKDRPLSCPQGTAAVFSRNVSLCKSLSRFSTLHLSDYVYISKVETIC